MRGAALLGTGDPSAGRFLRSRDTVGNVLPALDTPDRHTAGDVAVKIPLAM